MRTYLKKATNFQTRKKEEEDNTNRRRTSTVQQFSRVANHGAKRIPTLCVGASAIRTSNEKKYRNLAYLLARTAVKTAVLTISKQKKEQLSAYPRCAWELRNADGLRMLFRLTFADVARANR